MDTGDNVSPKAQKQTIGVYKMAENECTHNCDTCSANCSSREAESMLAKANPHSRVKKVIGVVSGKGGVGKSMVTSLLAVTMNRRGL